MDEVKFSGKITRTQIGLGTTAWIVLGSGGSLSVISLGGFIGLVYYYKHLLKKDRNEQNICINTIPNMSNNPAG